MAAQWSSVRSWRHRQHPSASHVAAAALLLLLLLGDGCQSVPTISEQMTSAYNKLIGTEDNIATGRFPSSAGRKGPSNDNSMSYADEDDGDYFDSGMLADAIAEYLPMEAGELLIHPDALMPKVRHIRDLLQTNETTALIDAGVEFPTANTTEKPERIWTRFANKTCYVKHIRGPVKNLKYLYNCTTIVGMLTIALMDEGNATEGNSIADYSFPELVEITGCLVIAYIEGAASMAHMFPKLRIIRGNNLVKHYALIVAFTEFDTIAFPSLTTISNGFVAISNNTKMCPPLGIDWDAITVQEPDYFSDEERNIVLPGNASNCKHHRNECGHCKDRHCWNGNECQLYETGMNMDGNITCHHLCIGGCTGTTANDCFRCRGPHFKQTCVEECTPDQFLNEQSHTCGTNQLCYMFGLLPLEGKCRQTCAEGSSHIVDPRKPPDFEHCIPCDTWNPDGKCLTICKSPGVVPFKFSQFSQLYRCQGYNGSLLIKMEDHEKMSRTVLFKYFGDLEVIYGTLEVHRSTVLHDLNFFENLRVIDPLPRELLSGRLAVSITHNRALSELFDWNIHNDLNVTRGDVLVADNTHLCPETRVRDFLRHVWLLDRNKTAEREITDGELFSNGYDAVCRHRDFVSRVVQIEHDGAKLQWRRFVPAPGLRLVGYNVMYTGTGRLGEPPHQEGIDLCSETHWHNQLIEDDGEDEEDFAVVHEMDASGQVVEWLQLTLSNLQQHQRYAYFIHAQVSMANETDVRLEAENGLTDVRYFTTRTRVPLPPFVYTIKKTEQMIKIKWFHPGWDLNRYVEEYVIDVYRLRHNVDELRRQRNYCDQPKVMTPTNVSEYYVAKEGVHDCCEMGYRNQHPRFMTVFLGVDGDPDVCGELDHDCRRDEKFHVLFSNDTYYTQDAARLAAIRAEEIPFLMPLLQFGGDAPIRHRHANITDPDYLYTMRVPSTIKNVLLINLQPFERYSIRVHSCTNETQCGMFYQHFERTLRSPLADRAELSVHSEERLPDVLQLTVVPPARPNGGLVVAYEVEHYLNTHQQFRTCLTGDELAAVGFRLIVTDLLVGEHMIRVRAITLGSSGVWSSVQLRYDLRHPLYILRYLAIVPGVILAAAIGVMVFRWLRKRGLLRWNRAGHRRLIDDNESMLMYGGGQRGDSIVELSEMNSSNNDGSAARPMLQRSDSLETLMSTVTVLTSADVDNNRPAVAGLSLAGFVKPVPFEEPVAGPPPYDRANEPVDQVVLSAHQQIQRRRAAVDETKQREPVRPEPEPTVDKTEAVELVTMGNVTIPVDLNSHAPLANSNTTAARSIAYSAIEQECMLHMREGIYDPDESMF